MKPTFVSGRKNLALTVMVPFDCPNNCPFCESKKEYATNRPNLEAVLNTMKLFFEKNNTLDVPEVVITGGEPMANIPALRAIINVIPSDKDIYINTTLIKKSFEAFCELVNNHPQIKGINVSRHTADYTSDLDTLHGIVPDTSFRKIKKPVRINCVVDSHTDVWAMASRWTWRGNIELSLRENFNTMTEEELHNPYSHHLPELAQSLRYVGHTQCKVCDTTIFETNRGHYVRYHKGLKNTFVPLGSNKYEINDIIIRQDGSIFCDWDFTNAHILPPQLLYNGTKDIMKRSRERMVEIATSETPKHHIGGCGGYVSYTCGGYGGCGGSSYCANISSCGGGRGDCGGSICG